MISAALGRSPVPSDIVHLVAYTENGFQLLCVSSPWVVANLWTCRARVTTESDSLGRQMIISMTLDLVDCMKCLVSHGRL